LPILIVSFIYCYYKIFSQFATYDDEGYLLITVSEFLRGGPLYDRVFTQYGPFYYLFNYLLFGWGIPVGHGTVRLLTVALWLLITLLVALFVLRVTRSRLLATAVYALVLADLAQLVHEPGHPHDLNTLLVTTAVFLASYSGRCRGDALGLALGMLAGAALMVKINVGLFLGLGLFLALTASARSDRTAKLIGFAVSAGALALPAALLRVHLAATWGWSYCAVMILALGPLLVLAWSGPRQCQAASKRSGYLWFAVGLFVTVGAIFGVTLAFGTSVPGLLRGVLFRPLGFGATFFIPAPFRIRSVAAAMASLVLFLILRRYAGRSEEARRRAGWVIDLLKLGFCVFVIAAGRRHLAGFLLCYGTPWLWLVLWPPRTSSAEGTEDFFPRLVLALVTGLEGLQAYPVAVTQTVLGTFLMIPVAALCAHDLASDLAAARPASEGARKRRRLASLALSWVILALLIVHAYQAYRNYHSLVRLDLRGTGPLRLSRHDVAVYRWVANNLHVHCDGFITLPGYNSFYFWAEKAPPTAFNTTLWWLLLDDREQQEIVQALSRCRCACVISRWGLQNSLLRSEVRGRPGSSLPLIRYITENFETIGRFDEYEFMVRRGREKVELRQDTTEMVP
jgi:hypothetical protein